MIQGIGLVLIAILAENMVLVKCLGVDEGIAPMRTEEDAWHMGVAQTMVMVLTALLCWLANTLILEYFGLEHFRLLAYALAVPTAIGMIRKTLHSMFPVLYRHLNEYLSRSLSNCAVLGVAYIITQRNYSLPQTLLYAAASGVGVLIVLVIFTGMQDQASFDNCPKLFRGMPITLITAGLMALALMGFYGLNVTA